MSSTAPAEIAPSTVNPEDNSGELAAGDEPDDAAPDPVDFRIWVPTTSGPLLVGLNLRIGGQPLRERFESTIAQSLQTVRKELNLDDQKTPVTWKAAVQHASQRPNIFGQSAAQLTGMQTGLIKQHDRNANKMVEEDEWRSFLFRDVGFAESIRLFGTDVFRYANRSDSRLFNALDRDGDRGIDEQEAALATESLLRTLDRNVDACLELSECLTDTGSDRGNDPWRLRRPNRQGNVVMDLAGYVNWSNLAYTVGGMQKRPSPFESFHPVRQIDEDSDQWISEDEVAKLLEVDPTLVLHVELDDSDPSAAQVRLDFTEAVGAEVERVNSSTLQLPSLSISATIDDQSLNSDSIWRVQIRGRGAEHPDALFAWLDADGDTRLSTREIDAAAPRVSRLVRKRGGPLQATDFPDAILIRLLRGDPAQDEGRFALIGPPPIPVEPDDARPAWAIALDTNRDGDISQNEFLGPIATFRRLDQNADGFLDDTEVSAVTSGKE
ncbi:MAG: hypothetical protein AAFV88_21640 [Planctomycetota bacterium]